MQRVSSLLPSWDWNRNGSTSPTASKKNSLDKVRGWADKMASPTNRLSTSRLSRDAFWPATLDKECDKAARILKSFCVDGFVVPDDRPMSPVSGLNNSNSSKILKKIPPRIMENAVGLAVFTSMRSGMWTSNSGGSGILMARKADGTWSPPSCLTLHTASLKFALGVDIYDCVVVINTFTMLEAMSRPRVTLGTDVGLTRGPLVTLGLLENEFRWTDLSDTVFTYVKARGQTLDVKLEGTELSERADENERFYGCNYSVPKILAGDINLSLPQLRPLTETLKAAEGRTDYDEALLEQLSSQPAPGDALVEVTGSPASATPSFGIPDNEDPDPFGVLALEKAGLEIREAGTGLRPDSNQFEYCPSPTSAGFPRVGRQSVDTFASRSNRGSYMSSKTVATERSHLTDACTQTTTPGSTPTLSPSYSDDGNAVKDIPEEREPEEVDYTKIDISVLRKLTAFPESYDEPPFSITAPETSSEESPAESSAQESIVQESTVQKNTPDKASAAAAVTEQEAEADADDEDEADTSDGPMHSDVDSDHDDDDDFDADGDFDDDDMDEPVVYEVATAQPPARMAIIGATAVPVKGAVVTIPRRIPPPLPIRSPARLSRQSKSEFGDLSMIGSPLRNEFELDGDGEEVSTPKPAMNQDAIVDQEVTTIVIRRSSTASTSAAIEEPATEEKPIVEDKPVAEVKLVTAEKPATFDKPVAVEKKDDELDETKANPQRSETVASTSKTVDYSPSGVTDAAAVNALTNTDENVRSRPGSGVPVSVA